MCVAILKSGLDAAIRLWSVMGALTGVAFGGITSFYFTNQSHQQQISQIKAENQILSSSLAKAAYNAKETSKIVSPIESAFESALKGETMNSEYFPASIKLLSSMPANEKKEFKTRLEKASMRLKYIETLPQAGEISVPKSIPAAAPAPRP